MAEIGININNECGKNQIEILDNIKNSGFKNVMITAKNKDFEEAIKYALQIGLKIPFVHLDTSKSDDLWVKGESNEKYVNDILRQLDICHKYNINLTIIHAVNGNPSRKVVKPNIHGTNCMMKILKHAEDLNIKIALENVDEPNFKHFTYLLKNIKSKSFGFCYDIGHHQLYNPKVNLLKKYASRLMAVHIHDNLMDWKYGFDHTRDLHLLPFDGKIDFEKICKNLSDANYKNVIMLEVHKIGVGEPRIYKDMTSEEFLVNAYNRATKIANKINN